MSVDKSLTIPGLTNGTAYKVKVKAVYPDGTSDVSNTVTGTPLTTPSAPGIHGVVPGDSQLSVSIDAPSSNGGASITNYAYQLQKQTTIVSNVPDSMTVERIGPIYYTDGDGVGSTSDLSAGQPTGMTCVDFHAAGLWSDETQIIRLDANSHDFNFDKPFTMAGWFKSDWKNKLIPYPAYAAAVSANTTTTSGYNPTVPVFCVGNPNTPLLLATIDIAGNFVLSSRPYGMDRGQPVITIIYDIVTEGEWFHVAVTGDLVDPNDPTQGVLVQGWFNGVSNEGSTILYPTPTQSHNDQRVVTFGRMPQDLHTTFAGSMFSVYWVNAALFDVTSSDIRTGSPLALPDFATDTTNLTAHAADIKFIFGRGSSLFSAAGAIPGFNFSFDQLSYNNGPVGKLRVTVPRADADWLATALSLDNLNSTVVSYFRDIYGRTQLLDISTPLVDGAHAIFTLTARDASGTPGTVREVYYDRSYPITVTYQDYRPLSVIQNDSTLEWVDRYPASSATPLVISGLDNGTSYRLLLRAINSAGRGTASAYATSTPARVPDTINVTGITIVALDGTAEVFFDVPASGGSPILRYEFSLNGGTSWHTVTTVIGVSGIHKYAIIGGMEATGNYSIRLRAVNTAGAGTGSVAKALTYILPPGTPNIDSITPGNQQLSVAFSESTDSSRDPATNYKYSTDGGIHWTLRAPASTASPLVIKPLVNGVTYNVLIRGVNAGGDGLVSSPSSGRPLTIPSAPVLTTSVGSDRRIYLNYTQGSDGGSPVIKYQYQANTAALTTNGAWLDASFVKPGQLTLVFFGNGHGNPLTYDVVANDTPYNIRIRAVNAAGVSAASNILSATAGGPPGLGYIVNVVSDGIGNAVVSFSVPDNGGSAITDVSVFAIPASIVTGGTLDANDPSTMGGQSAASYQVFGTFDAGSNTVTAQCSEFGVPFFYVIQLRNAHGQSPALSTPFPATIYSKPGLDSNNYTPLAVGFNHEMVLTVGVPWLSYPQNDPPYAGLMSLSSYHNYTGGETPTVYEWTSDGGTTIRTIDSVENTYTADQNPANIVLGQPSPFAATFKTLHITSDISGSPLSNGQQYQVQIRARNTHYASDWSPIRYITPLAIPPTPRAILSATGTRNQLAVNVLHGNLESESFWYSFVINPTSLDQSTWPSSELTIGADNYIYNTGSFSGSGFTPGSTPTFFLQGDLVNGQQIIDGQPVTIYLRTSVLTQDNTRVYSPYSQASVATPYGPPSAPSITSVNAADHQLVVNFTAPTDNGGKPITNYQYSVDNGTSFKNISPPNTTSPLVISGLTNSTSYQVKIRAVNAISPGDISNMVAGTPAGIPFAPDGLRAVQAHNGALFEIYGKGPNTNGERSTFYMSYSLDDGPWVDLSVSSVTYDPAHEMLLFDIFAPIVYGHVYSIRVKYTNKFGSVISAPFTGVAYTYPSVPRDPGNPTDVYPDIVGWPLQSDTGSSGFFVTWLPPAFDGGAPIVKYNIYKGDANGELHTNSNGAYQNFLFSVGSSPEAVITMGNHPAAQYSSSQPAGFLELDASTANVNYYVTAVNAAGLESQDLHILVNIQGQGSFSGAFKLATPPQPPTITSVQSSSTLLGALDVTFNPPPADTTLNSYVSQYVYTASRPTFYEFSVSPNPYGAGAWSPWQATAWPPHPSVKADPTPFTITGLTNGVTYQVKMRTVSRDQYGTDSVVVTGVPVAPMSAPVLTTALGGDATILITFTPPSSIPAGHPVTKYQYTFTGGATVADMVGSSTSTLVGLANGATYDVQIRAVNNVSVSPWSNTISVSLPVTPPAPPVISTITPADKQLSVAFTPGFDNGAAITAYKYSTDNGASWVLRPGTSSPVVITSTSSTPITSLTNGFGYTVRLKAISSAGESPASIPASGTPAGVPLDAPTNLSVSVYQGAMKLQFTPGTKINGAAITNYQYTTDNWVSSAALSPASNTSPVLITRTSDNHALSLGTVYTVGLRAVNVVGVGPNSTTASCTYYPPAAVSLPGSLDVYSYVQPKTVLYDPTTGQPYICVKFGNLGKDTAGNTATNVNALFYKLEGAQWLADTWIGDYGLGAFGSNVQNDFYTLFVDAKRFNNGNQALVPYNTYTLKAYAETYSSVNPFAPVSGPVSSVLTLTPHPWEPAAPTAVDYTPGLNGRADVVYYANALPAAPDVIPDTAPTDFTSDIFDGSETYTISKIILPLTNDVTIPSSGLRPYVDMPGQSKSVFVNYQSSYTTSDGHRSMYTETSGEWGTGKAISSVPVVDAHGNQLTTRRALLLNGGYVRINYWATDSSHYRAGELAALEALLNTLSSTTSSDSGYLPGTSTWVGRTAALAARTSLYNTIHTDIGHYPSYIASNLAGTFTLEFSFALFSAANSGEVDLVRSGYDDTNASSKIPGLKLTADGRALKLYVSSNGTSYDQVNGAVVGYFNTNESHASTSTPPSHIAINQIANLVITYTSAGNLVCYFNRLKVYDAACSGVFQGDKYTYAPNNINTTYDWFIGNVTYLLVFNLYVESYATIASNYEHPVFVTQNGLTLPNGQRQAYIPADIYTKPYYRAHRIQRTARGSYYTLQYQVNGGAWITPPDADVQLSYVYQPDNPTSTSARWHWRNPDTAVSMPNAYASAADFDKLRFGRVTIRGLQNNSTASIRLRWLGDFGAVGAASSSLSVFPVPNAPEPPTITGVQRISVSHTPVGGGPAYTTTSLRVSIQPPVDDGGSAITGYKIGALGWTSLLSPPSFIGSSSPDGNGGFIYTYPLDSITYSSPLPLSSGAITIDDPSPGPTSYAYIIVKAVNAVGIGKQSAVFILNPAS